MTPPPNPHIMPYNVLQWNINGYNTRYRMGELQRLIAVYNPICICIQHIGVTPISPPKNYSLAVTSPLSPSHLRTAILVHYKHAYTPFTLSPNPFQTTAVIISLPNLPPLTVCSSYNQPSCKYDTSDITSIMHQLTTPYLILGDFNAHSPIWGGTHSDLHGGRIEKILEQTSLCCLNTDLPTYRSTIHNTFSAIDLSFASDDVAPFFDWSVVQDRYSSDHHPILLTYSDQCPAAQIPSYNLSKANWEQYELSSMNISDFSSDSSPAQNIDYFTSFVTSLAQTYVPLTTPSKKPREVPWWSPKLSAVVKFKHKVERFLKRISIKQRRILTDTHAHTNMSPYRFYKLVRITVEKIALKTLYNKVCAVLKRATLQSKIISWRLYISSFTSRTPLSTLWGKFRRITGRGSRPPLSPLQNQDSGLYAYDTDTIASIHANHFSQVSSDQSFSPQFLRHKLEAESSSLSFRGERQAIYNVPFTMPELLHALDVCSDTTPGPDNLAYTFYRHLHPRALAYLLKLYNQLWSEAYFPPSWGHAYAIPVPKPGKDGTLPTNYRPIVLTSCLCKLMEKMINPRLFHYAESHQLISPYQNGSRPGRTTLHSLARLEHQIRLGFSKKQPTVAIFFDIAKAYDTTWRYRILQILHDSGMRGPLPRFLCNFLSDRTFQVKLNGVLSEKKPLNNGIPQGSVLSSTLFMIAINEVTTCLPPGIGHSLYVDDFAIYYTSPSLNHIQRKLNIALNAIHSWTTRSGFQFSVDKSKAVVFYKNKRHIRHQTVRLNLGPNVIKLCSHAKFLGLIFDTHLNWKSHVADLKARCFRRATVMKSIARVHWGADRSTLMLFYNATVLSVLDYGCSIYGTASPSVLHSLDSVHHMGVRISSGAFRSSRICNLLCEAGVLPLSYHRQLVMMRTAISLFHDPTLHDLFTSALGSDLVVTPPFTILSYQMLLNHNIPIDHPTIPKSTITPWTIRYPTVCLCLADHMSNRTPHEKRSLALDHLFRQHPHAEYIYTDGSKIGDSAGCAALSSHSELQYTLHLHSTVFTAELWALHNALDLCSLPTPSHYVICSDSKSALQALRGLNPKDSLLVEILHRIHTLQIDGNEITLCWIPAHVGIRGNEVADSLAKDACRGTPSHTLLRPKDLIPLLRRTIYEKWRREWTALLQPNQLRSIKDDIHLWPSSVSICREEQTILTRLRIGHTRLTQGHLMSSPQGQPPECTTCRVPLTICHIFCTCKAYTHERRRYFRRPPNNIYSLRDILADTNSFSFANIKSFLKSIDLYKDI